MPKLIAGHVMAICTTWLTWALLAPIIAGPVPMAEPPHNCPAPYTQHGVGKDLKTFTRTVDRCAQQHAQ
ncbi:hypothetical protein FHR70_000667 [Microvirga lupini]|uniref:Uncharacterized protein n=1 Tax=Microvirga lupini TaxID=420324 RepID=A0A7W4VJA0_9HYPH|nr:hypothetical protein [Microvirga lupini]MBB3017627.1 hypothetical protein [Microvirga lupini]